MRKDWKKSPEHRIKRGYVLLVLVLLDFDFRRRPIKIISILSHK